MSFKLREVDGDDESDTLFDLNGLTFTPYDAKIHPEVGRWWIVTHNATPCAFAGLQPSTYYPGFDYFSRVGVMASFRGNGLQRRLMRALELASRRHKSRGIITDCTNDNVASANNILRSGYSIYWPEHPWALPNAIYWRKLFEEV